MRYSWSIPSCVKALDELSREMKHILEIHGLVGLCFTIELLSRECINNSIFHAHKCDESKRIHVELSIGRKWVCIKVDDHGQGFNWRQAFKRKPEETAESGRGLTILRLYAHRLHFNRKGNKIEVWVDKKFYDQRRLYDEQV